MKFFYLSDKSQVTFEKLGIVKCITTIFADNKKALKLDKLCGYEIDENNSFFVTKGGKQRLLCNAVLTRESFKIASQKMLDMFQLDEN